MKPSGLLRKSALSRKAAQARASRKSGRFARPFVAAHEAGNEQARPGEHALSLLFRISIRLQATMDRCFLPFGTTAQEAAVLVCCAEARGISAGGLAAAMGRDKGKITRFVDRLEAKRLVTRKSHSHDRRLLIIEATRRGRLLAPQLRNKFEEVQQKFFAEIPANDIARLELILSQLLANAGHLVAKKGSAPVGL